MDRRIFGIENEYGVTCTFKGQRRLSPDEVARYLFRKVVSWGRSSNVFLANGARLYLDVGSHPEYATPECDDIIDLVTHDKAGERVLEGLLVDAERRLRDEGISGDVYLFKNNTDSAGNSYGCHENYLVSRHGEFSKLADVLIPFLVTRQIICGAGKVTQTPRGASYSVSQRAEHIWEGVSSATTRSRPIINTRDEPHADAERFRRLHVIVGDSNMSETTTMLKVASCDLVLRMIEEGVVMRDLTMENPIRAIREISHDMTGKRKVRLANGREASVLDIQGEYLSRVRDFVDRRELHTPVIEASLDLWERGLKAVESGDLSLVEREIDWVIKWKLLERYRERHGLPLLRHGLGASPGEIADIFRSWNEGDLESFLIEITADVLAQQDDATGKPFIDIVLDQAEQKGTGRWTVQSALDLGVPITGIAEATFARALSGHAEQRGPAQEAFGTEVGELDIPDRDAFIEDVRQALYASKVVAYAQGFDQIKAGSDEYDWNVDPGAMATIWRGGCIIRARFLNRIREAYDDQPDLPSLLVAPYFADAVRSGVDAWRRIVAQSAQAGIPAPAFASSLAYYDGLRRDRLPAALIQGLRDNFGAHTYKRVDREGSFHVEWAGDKKEHDA